MWRAKKQGFTFDPPPHLSGMPQAAAHSFLAFIHNLEENRRRLRSLARRCGCRARSRAGTLRLHV